MPSKARWIKSSFVSVFHAPSLMALALVSLMLCSGADSSAGEISVTALDSSGAPLDNAVVYAVPASGKTTIPEKGKSVIIDQVNKEFVPLVLVIQAGTAVNFPNRDDIRHHVYSLSQAKMFELPLYIGNPANPVVFDRPGAVALGCNIHDWMFAYIYVVETPYFTIIGPDGKGRLKDIPAGAYKLMVWHHRMKGEPEAFAVEAQVNSSVVEKTFSLSLKPQFKIHRAPTLSTRGYR